MRKWTYDIPKSELRPEQITPDTIEQFSPLPKPPLSRQRVAQVLIGRQNHAIQSSFRSILPAGAFHDTVIDSRTGQELDVPGIPTPSSQPPPHSSLRSIPFLTIATHFFPPTGDTSSSRASFLAAGRHAMRANAGAPRRGRRTARRSTPPLPSPPLPSRAGVGKASHSEVQCPLGLYMCRDSSCVAHLSYCPGCDAVPMPAFCTLNPPQPSGWKPSLIGCADKAKCGAHVGGGLFLPGEAVTDGGVLGGLA